MYPTPSSRVDPLLMGKCRSVSKGVGPVAVLRVPITAMPLPLASLCNKNTVFLYIFEYSLVDLLVCEIFVPFADTVEERIENINEYNTFSLYSNVCRSLFERHKLMFAFLLCVSCCSSNVLLTDTEQIAFVYYHVVGRILSLKNIQCKYKKHQEQK